MMNFQTYFAADFFAIAKPLPISITKTTAMGVRPTGSSSDSDRKGRADHMNS